MLRIYKMPNGRTYRYEEGDQPEGAVLVEMAGKGETPRERAAKAPAKRRATRKKAE